MGFRKYLLISVPIYRLSYMQLVLSCHDLAIQRLSWNSRRQPRLPRERRLCRLCHVCVEDEAHALLECGESYALEIRDDLRELLLACRDEFWVDLAAGPTNINRHVRLGLRVDAHECLTRLIRFSDVRTETAHIVGRLAWKVFKVFQSVPLYIPPQLPA